MQFYLFEFLKNAPLGTDDTLLNEYCVIIQCWVSNYNNIVIVFLNGRRRRAPTNSFRKIDAKQTAAGKTQRHNDLITFFRTSSTITVQLPAQITGYVNRENISCYNPTNKEVTE